MRALSDGIQCVHAQLVVSIPAGARLLPRRTGHPNEGGGILFACAQRDAPTRPAALRRGWDTHVGGSGPWNRLDPTGRYHRAQTSQRSIGNLHIWRIRNERGGAHYDETLVEAAQIGTLPM